VKAYKGEEIRSSQSLLLYEIEIRGQLRGSDEEATRKYRT
jgi:hypothetical protein